MASNHSHTPGHLHGILFLTITRPEFWNFQDITTNISVFLNIAHKSTIAINYDTEPYQRYLYLTLWLRLVYQSAQKYFLIGRFVQQIGPLHSTIMARLADKSAKLIVHARHGWPITRPRDNQPLKDKNLCLSITG